MSCLSLGLSFLSQWLRRKRWGGFLSLADKDGIYQPEPWESMPSISCSGTKVKIKAHPRAVMGGPLPLPSQSREVPFQTQPQTLFTWVGDGVRE